MDSLRWQRLKALFESALDKEPAERRAHLSQACSDPSLRAEVERLLRYHEETTGPTMTGGEERLRSDSGPEFRVSDRFQLEEQLGSGAFGVVYRAYDRKRKSVVALKTLSSSSPEALYRLKREFRSLADITHPNLVRLYELISEGPVWFFTMELVEGVTFLEFVRPNRAGPSAAVDHARLRPSLGQLVEGVLALHQAGRLHRDLKPSNVLVSREGCVRILDFGLVTDLSWPGARQSSRIVGTPAYMSPEQTTGEPLTGATDWYSVGVMLYEALTGSLPFRGGFVEALLAKQFAAPSFPSSVGKDVPPDLVDLCRSLLDPDPVRRFSGPEVLQRLRLESPPPPRAPAPGRSVPFVGRRDQLEDLRRAFAVARGGATSVAAVHGPSGIGKTALIRFFLEELVRESPGAVIFSARCYEQESVPYKAFDGIVDALAAYLSRLPTYEAEGVLPRDVLALARLFPVLKQVPAVAAARRRFLQVIDAQELRRRGFGALRDLLARLGEQRVMVLFIDDLQWGDLDSAALLGELLRPPDPPRLLLIGAYRTEEAETSTFLSHVLPLRSRAAAVIEFSELALGEMPATEANDLARLLLVASPTGVADHAATIARESRGNPFLLGELARHAGASSDSPRWEPAAAAGSTVGIDDMVHARVRGLPAPARRLLETVCVSGQPVEQGVAVRVAGLADEELAALDLLKSDRVVRTRAVGESTMLEAYHDRIREAVVRLIPAAGLASWHAALGVELERSAQADPERLAMHFEAGGDPARAADYARRAAERASESLAFEHAARLYSLALRLYPRHLDLHRLRILLADSLASAGRGAESAARYLEAAAETRGLEAQELRRRAAQQLLTSGHIQEGLDVMEALLADVGMSMPRTRWRALVSILWRRLLLWLRGTAFQARSASEIAPDRLFRLDTCWSVTVGLTFVEPLMGWVYQSRHVLLALRAGEPYRVVRALALEAGFNSATGGARARRRADALLQRARDLSSNISNPHGLALTTFADGFSGYFGGGWTRALGQLEASEAMFRERCTGVAWELNASQLYALRCLYYLGRARDIASKLGALLDDVRGRGDLFLEAALRTTFLTYLALSRDDPRQAEEQLESVSGLGLHKRFMLQHFWELEARVLLALYVGDGEAAYEVLRRHKAEFRRSELGRIQQNRIFASFWRGRSALAAAASAPRDARRGLLEQAQADADVIGRQRTIWGSGFERLLRAGLALAADRREQAVDHLRACQIAFEAAEVVGAATMAARFRCGQLTGGPEGAAMSEEAQGWFTDQGFVRPDHLASVYVPEVAP